jgi:predicted Ser/Thr protein kinase
MDKDLVVTAIGKAIEAINLLNGLSMKRWSDGEAHTVCGCAEEARLIDAWKKGT